MKLIPVLIIIFSCAGPAKQERIFFNGDIGCIQTKEKILCTRYNDPSDPVHLVDGVEREVEITK